MGCARFVWNKFVAHNQKRYDETGKFDFHAQLSAMLPQWKRDPQTSWLTDAPSISLVDVSRRYDAALHQALKDRKKKSLNKTGFPTFHKKKENHGSLYLSGQSLLFKHADTDKARGWFRLPKHDGEAGMVKIHGGRWPSGRVVSARLRLKGSEWTVSVQFDAPAPRPKHSVPSRPVLGIDLGLDALVTRSDGVKHVAPRFYRRAMTDLKLLQRSFNKEETKRREVGKSAKDRSKRQRRRLNAIVDLHRKIANRRKDYTHKISHELTTKAQAIGIETCGVAGIARTRLATSLYDAGWSELIRQLEYKAAWRGREIRRMNRFERSTGCCPDCGLVAEKLTLDKRQWKCPGCGRLHDRDIAAARWIELRAQAPVKVVAEAGTGKPLWRGIGLRRKPPG